MRFLKQFLHYCGVYPIIIGVRREVIQLDERAWDVFLVILGVVLAKVTDETVERLKRKTPRKPGKHAKRS